MSHLTLEQIAWALAGAKHIASDNYLFPNSVRLPCPCLAYSPHVQRQMEQTCTPCWELGTVHHNTTCSNCRGHNWLPAKDGWWEAAREAGMYLEVMTCPNSFAAEVVGNALPIPRTRTVYCATAAEAWFRALLAAVEAMPSVTLGEAQL